MDGRAKGVHRQWLIEVFLSPSTDFHNRIITNFKAENVKINTDFELCLLHTDFSRWDIQSLPNFTSEKVYISTYEKLLLPISPTSYKMFLQLFLLSTTYFSSLFFTLVATFKIQYEIIFFLDWYIFSQIIEFCIYFYIWHSMLSLLKLRLYIRPNIWVGDLLKKQEAYKNPSLRVLHVNVATPAPCK